MLKVSDEMSKKIARWYDENDHRTSNREEWDYVNSIIKDWEDTQQAIAVMQKLMIRLETEIDKRLGMETSNVS